MPDPAAETLRDSFTTPVLSACWSTEGAVTGAAPGGGAAFSSPAVGTSAKLEAADLFTLADSFVLVQWGALPASGNLSLTLSGNTWQGVLTYRSTVSPAQLRSRLALFGGPILTHNRAYAGEQYWRLRPTESGAGVVIEVSVDGASWTTELAQDGQGDLQIGVRLLLDSDGATTQTARLAAYNGGGAPDCPTAPGTPPFAPADGPATGQSYTWRDAKGQTATTHVSLAGTVTEAAAAAAALRPLLEACSDAALNGALGPLYVDRFAFGSAAHGVEVGDQLVIAGVAHRTGRAVELVLPAARPALFTPRGTADVTPGSGPVGALADSWQRHGVTADGEGFYARAARRRRQGQRRVYSAYTRRPALGGPGL